MTTGDACCRDPRPLDCPPKSQVVCPPGVAPFGGPASGLWPSGSAGVGILPSTCKLPDLFTECFQGCSAPSNCGWVTFFGNAIFTGQNVQLDPMGGASVIYKSLAGVPPVNTTMQIRFREINAPPNPASLYAMGAVDSIGTTINGVALFGNGTLNVYLGPITYSGSWTPKAGAFHTVHLTVSSSGTPSLFIDQVFIPLVVGGVPSPAPFTNAFSLTAVNPTPDGPSIFFSAFVTRGVFPPTTTFCCPNGQALAG